MQRVFALCLGSTHATARTARCDWAMRESELGMRISPGNGGFPIEADFCRVPTTDAEREEHVACARSLRERIRADHAELFEDGEERWVVSLSAAWKGQMGPAREIFEQAGYPEVTVVPQHLAVMTYAILRQGLDAESFRMNGAVCVEFGKARMRVVYCKADENVVEEFESEDGFFDWFRDLCAGRLGSDPSVIECVNPSLSLCGECVPDGICIRLLSRFPDVRIYADALAPLDGACFLCPRMVCRRFWDEGFARVLSDDENAPMAMAYRALEYWFRCAIESYDGNFERFEQLANKLIEEWWCFVVSLFVEAVGGGVEDKYVKDQIVAVFRSDELKLDFDQVRLIWLWKILKPAVDQSRKVLAANPFSWLRNAMTAEERGKVADAVKLCHLEGTQEFEDMCREKLHALWSRQRRLSVENVILPESGFEDGSSFDGCCGQKSQRRDA